MTLPLNRGDTNTLMYTSLTLQISQALMSLQNYPIRKGQLEEHPTPVSRYFQ